MKKKIIATLLCATLAFSGTICVSAKENVKEYDGFEDLHEYIVLPDNVIRISSVGIERDTEYGLSGSYTYKGKNTGESFELYFNDYVTGYKDIEVVPDIYGTSYKTIDSTTSGGIYKKIRIKLSAFNDEYQPDGTYNLEMLDEMVNFDYKLHIYEKGYKNSTFSYANGAIISRMLPDENGEIEIYVSTDVGVGTTLIATCSCSNGKGQAACAARTNPPELVFGNINGDSYVDVNDVTDLQLYLVGLKELDSLGLFHADINCDDIYNIKDVTHLQLGIAKC